jgi:hypothetical protein
MFVQLKSFIKVRRFASYGKIFSIRMQATAATRFSSLLNEMEVKLIRGSVNIIPMGTVFSRSDYEGAARSSMNLFHSHMHVKIAQQAKYRMEVSARTNLEQKHCDISSSLIFYSCVFVLTRSIRVY